MATMPIQRKQPRDRRYNINLTDDESQFFEAMAKLSGQDMAVIMREFMLKQALSVMLDDEDSILKKLLHTGAPQHLERG